MRNIILPFIALLIINNATAQGRPPIVFNKTVSADFDKIKTGMNDLVKNFGKNPTVHSGGGYISYEMNFKIGNADVSLQENNETQHLEISFTGSYYSGTVTDFAAFYDALVNKVREMLASTYTAELEKKTATYNKIAFLETGKESAESLTSVYITYDFLMATNPRVSIEFYKKVR